MNSVEPFGTEGEIDKFQLSVQTLDEDSALEAVCMHMDRLDVMQAKLKEARNTMNEVLLEYLDKHGEFDWGDKRFFIVKQKTEKLANVAGLVQVFLEEHSIEDLVACLSSNCFKPGEVGARLGDDARARFFAVEFKRKPDGKLIKKPASMPKGMK